MRRRESRRRSRHNRTSKSPAMWPGFLAAQIVREYSLLLIFLCKIFPEKLDKARGGRRGILDSPFQSTPPARGATTPARRDRSALHHFNPRPPRGGRLGRGAGGADEFDFNPRPPRGGRRRNSQQCDCKCSYFNPRPPRGGRRRAGRSRIAPLNFNPRPPRGGRLAQEGFEQVYSDISIHAPREGGDRHARQIPRVLEQISIHAPREGGDR